MSQGVFAIPAPEFVDLAGLESGWSIGRTKAYDLLREGAIRSVVMRGNGKLRGKRLIDVASVREYLASCPNDIDPLLSEQLRKTRRGENWRTNKSRRRRSGHAAYRQDRHRD